QQFFGALQEQVPELAAYLNENSDDEYEIKTHDTSNNQTKSRKSSTSSPHRSTSIDTLPPPMEGPPFND
ncbi:unnamed protein product, partial [Rotaria sp. Silwood1]